jgi:Transposase DDE domain
LLHRALVSEPGACIRRLGGGRRGLEMRFTRFLRHSSVTPAAIFSDAGAKTGRLAAGREVLAIQDTSDLSLGGGRRRGQGFGPVGKGGALRGLVLHAVLAVDAASGEVLGLAGAEVWNRTGGQVTARAGRTLEEKESLRWVSGAAAAGKVLAGAASITVVADRESDVYEDFARCPANVQLLVRSRHDRCLEGGGRLYARLDAQPRAGGLEVIDIPAKPGQAARTATFELRFCAAKVKAPGAGMPKAALRQLPPSLPLSVVDFKEAGAQEGIAPVHWRLITTHKIETREAALALVQMYRKRWAIEEYFHTLKTGGFAIEDARVGAPGAMMVLTAAAAAAAVTVMQLIKARDNPLGPPITSLFDAQDCQIIGAVNADYEGPAPRPRQKNPHPKQSLAYATWVLGRLGGWTGYYDKPGSKTLSRGLQAFERIRQGAKLMAKDM